MSAQGRLIKAGLANDYVVIITADHGSAEDKLYPDGRPKPAIVVISQFYYYLK